MKDLTIICVETRVELWPKVYDLLKTGKEALGLSTKPVLVIGDSDPSSVSKDLVDLGIDIRQCAPITDTSSYSKVILKESKDWFDTSHALFIQHDGFIVNPKAWDDIFLQYDYIGAPWPLDPAGRYAHHPIITEKNNVGNGGFSLRSKRLCNLVSDRYKELLGAVINPWFYYPEDSFICRNQRIYFEKKGILFAPIELAVRFSVENDVYRGQFGFHGSETININRKLGVFT